MARSLPKKAVYICAAEAHRSDARGGRIKHHKFPALSVSPTTSSPVYRISAVTCGNVRVLSDDAAAAKVHRLRTDDDVATEEPKKRRSRGSAAHKAEVNGTQLHEIGEWSVGSIYRKYCSSWCSSE